MIFKNKMRRCDMSLFLTLSCRSRQTLDSIKTSFQKKTDSTIHVGAGCAATAADVLRRHRVKKPLVLLPAGPCAGKKTVLQSLEEGEVAFVPWELDGPVHVRDIENIRLYYIGAGCDSFVALGSDELLAAAKLAAARVTQPRKTAGELSGKTLRKKPPVIMAIPTGLESRVLAPSLTLEGGLSMNGERLRPPVVLLDRELLPETDRQTMAAVCLRLFGLAVEGLLDPRSKNRQNQLRLSAAALLGHLERLAEDCFALEDDLFREAAWLGGQRGAYALALAEEAGKELDIHPGAALAAILPALLELYAKKAPKAMETLNSLWGEYGDYTKEEPEAQEPAPAEEPAAEPAAETEAETVTPPPADLLWQIRNLAWRCGLPEQLPVLDDAMLYTIAEKAARTVNAHGAGPLVLGPKALQALLRKACGQE